MKHFDADFEQWRSDEGVGHTFPLREIGERQVHFEGLSYELIDDELLITLQLEDSEGTTGSEQLRLRKR